MSDIAFAQNWCNLFFINITPGATEKTWARLGAGLVTPDPDGNEEISQDGYLDGDGMADSEVTGGQLTISFEGHREHSDPAQNYIAGLLLSYGQSRKTDFRWVSPEGNVLEGKCTIANIKPFGGDANEKEEFSFEIHMNGLPSFKEANTEAYPEEIEVSDVTVTEGEKAQATVTVTPDGASKSLVYAIEDTKIATVDADGNVTGIEKGETQLNVKSAVKPAVQKTVKVTVAAKTTQQSQSSPKNNNSPGAVS